MEFREPLELIEFLAPYPDHVQELTLKARRILVERLWPVNEVFYDAMTAVCSGFSYTEKATGNFFNLAVFSNHVTLIFPDGAKLHDPESRLKGGGTRVRHIRLTSLELLEDPYIIDLIEQSSTSAVRPAEPVEPTVIVKVMKGPKRRPTRSQN